MLQILLKLWLIGNRASCRPIQSVIILVIKQIGLPLRGRPILLITRMITDRIRLHSVLLPLLIIIIIKIIIITIIIIQFKEHRLQIIVVAKIYIYASQLFISRMPKMRAIPQLVSAPLNPIPIAEHFRRSHPPCEHSRGQHI